MGCSGKKCHESQWVVLERITKRSKWVVLERSVMKESHREVNGCSGKKCHERIT